MTSPSLRLSDPGQSVIARCRALTTHGPRCRRSPVSGSELCAVHLSQVVRSAQARARGGRRFS